MSETTPLIKAALNLRVGAGFDIYERLILKYEPTMLFVEHDRKFCEKIATKVIEL